MGCLQLHVNDMEVPEHPGQGTAPEPEHHPTQTGRARGHLHRRLVLSAEGQAGHHGLCLSGAPLRSK